MRIVVQLILCIMSVFFLVAYASASSELLDDMSRIESGQPLLSDAGSQQLADNSAQKNSDFFQKNAKKTGVKTLPSGVQYRVITKGSGSVPTTNDTVLVDYEGRLLNGTVFDSSYKRGQPIALPINHTIQGWQDALIHMPVGSVWMVYIPADKAYGDAGVPGTIPPQSDLIFKIHLLRIES